MSKIKKHNLYYILTVMFLSNTYFTAQNVDSLKKLIQSSENNKKVDLLNELATSYYYSYPESTIIYARIAQEIAKEINYIKGEARALDCIGNSYDIRGEFHKSLEYFLHALKLREGIDDSIGVSDSYFNIGASYFRSGYYNNALEYCQKSLELSRKINYKKGIASSLDIIGTVYSELNDLDAALKSYIESLAVEKELNNKQGIIISLTNIADILDEKNEFNKALNYYYEALEICTELNDKVGKAIILNNIGLLFLNLKRYAEAKENLTNALKSAIQVGDINLQMQIYDSFYKYYRNINDCSNALQYYIAYSELKDSVFNETKSQQIADMMTKYQTERIENAKNILELKNKKLENDKLYLISGIIVLLLFSVIFYYKIKLKQKNKELYSTEKMLRMQMNPHFISNSMAAVQNFILSEDIENSLDYIGNFTELMRKIIESSEHEYIALADEIENLKVYLELEKSSFAEIFDYKIKIDKSIDTEEIKIPPMLIQPYIENSILHGFADKEDNCRIMLSFKKINEKNLLCTIEDNGIGREKAAERKIKTKKYKSIGQRNVEQRIQLINKIYKTNLKVKIIDLIDKKGKPKGTRVELDIII
ncbi:MAG: tetratricopeptide repeat protein [Ignavibacteriales bacterium]|nr:tetratricopeptide repeat protein [Ignavibacteriales bacterium]